MPVTLDPSSAYSPVIGFTRSDIRGHMQAFFHDTSTGFASLLNRWIDRAQNIVVSKATRWFLEKSFGTFATANGTKAYTLAWDDVLFITRLLDNTNSVYLDDWTRDQLDREHPNYSTTTSKNKPTIWAPYGRSDTTGRPNLQLYPTPDAAYTIEVFGYYIPGNLTDPDKSRIPGLFHHAIEAWVLYYAAQAKGARVATVERFKKDADEFTADLAGYQYATNAVRQLSPRNVQDALGYGSEGL